MLQEIGRRPRLVRTQQPDCVSNLAFWNRSPTSRRGIGRPAALAALALGVLVWIGLATRPHPLPRRVEFALTNVSDATTCAHCHSQQVESFSESPHLATLGPAREDTAIRRLIAQRIGDPADSTWRNYF